MSPLKSWSQNRFLLFVVLGGLACLSGGCDSSARLTPVTGRVTGADGKPLTSGTVIFHPNKDKGNTFGGEAVGDINGQGDYTLQVRGKPGVSSGLLQGHRFLDGPHNARQHQSKYNVSRQYDVFQCRHHPAGKRGGR